MAVTPECCPGGKQEEGCKRLMGKRDDGEQNVRDEKIM